MAWTLSIGLRDIRGCCVPLLVLAAGCDGGDGPSGPSGAVDEIIIAPAGATFGAVGSTVQFEASALDASGEPVSDAAIDWSTTGSGVIDVESGTGLVTSVGDGTDRLVATVGSVSAEVRVDVSQVPVTVAHDGDAVALHRIGDTFSLRPLAVDSNGVRVARPTAFDYASSAPQVVAVDEFGVVQANDFGSAEITVTSGSLGTTVAAVVAAAAGQAVPILDEVIPCAGARAGAYSCDRVDLLAYLPPAGLGAGPDAPFVDLAGWRDPMTMNEYLLVAHSEGVAFVDVSELVHPRTVGFLPASFAPSDRRDAEVLGDVAYVAADAPGHGLQVFDLTRLRGLAGFTVFAEDERYIEIGSATSLAVHEATGYAFVTEPAVVGITCPAGLHMIDLSSPLHPAFSGCFADPIGGSVRDAHCAVYAGPDDHAGREVCIVSAGQSFSIVDVTDKSTPFAISTTPHPGPSAHQGWWSTDHRFFFQSDDLDELLAAETLPIPTRTIVWDVTDLDAPVLATVYEGPATTVDRGVIVLESTLYVSNGTYGLRVVDVTDPANPMETGWFDTFPEFDVPSRVGAWATFPFGEDRLFTVDRRGGLFVLRPSP